MPIPAHKPDLTAYKSALADVVLRTLFSLTILTVGFWAPASYFDKFGLLSLYGPGPLAEAGFVICKLAAFIYGAMALWSIRCAFLALWHPGRSKPAQRGGAK
jgi:hypothetical protein